MWRALSPTPFPILQTLQWCRYLNRTAPSCVHQVYVRAYYYVYITGFPVVRFSTSSPTTRFLFLRFTLTYNAAAVSSFNNFFLCFLGLQNLAITPKATADSTTYMTCVHLVLYYYITYSQRCITFYLFLSYLH